VRRRTIAGGVRETKLDALADGEGLTVDELLETYGTDAVVPGICTNDGCDFTAHYEPDQDEGWCEECETPSVASALILAGVI
jgi:hypothetical protein